MNTKNIPSRQPYSVEDRQKALKEFEAAHKALDYILNTDEVRHVARAFKALLRTWKREFDNRDYEALRYFTLEYAEVIERYEERMKERSERLDSADVSGGEAVAALVGTALGLGAIAWLASKN